MDGAKMRVRVIVDLVGGQSRMFHEEWPGPDPTQEPDPLEIRDLIWAKVMAAAEKREPVRFSDHNAGVYVATMIVGITVEPVRKVQE